MNLFELSSAESSDFAQPKGLAKPLWDHQRAALEYIVRARRVMIADEVGVGKTAVAIAAIRMLSAFPALIVPPAYLRHKWRRDIETWLPASYVRVVEPGEPLIVPDELEDPDFFVVSYNLLGQQEHDDSGKPKTGPNHLVRALLTKPLRAFIADEGHYLKNTKALRTKACLRVSRDVPLRLILGATPLETGPRELLAQLDILDQTKMLFGSGWRFLQRYCNRWGIDQKARCELCLGEGVHEEKTCPKCHGRGLGFSDWDFSGAMNLDELNVRLRSACYIRREKTQVHKSLPPLTVSRIDVDISNRVDYRTAEQDFLGWLRSTSPNQVFTASRAEALVKVGFLKRLVSIGKRKAANDWIDSFLEENPDQKLVVFTYLRATAQYLGERYDAPVILGGVPVERREEYIDDFQNGDTRLIVVSIEAGGVGIELFAASNCLFLELDWVPTTHTQATGRLHRPGQTSPVTAWYLIGHDTIEEQIYDLLIEREEIVARATQGADVTNPFAHPGDPDVLKGLLTQLL